MGSQDTPSRGLCRVGDSGNYVIMIDNGIEHAHLSMLCEVRSFLRYHLSLSKDEVATLFEGWYKQGPLRGNFLVGIGLRA